MKQPKRHARTHAQTRNSLGTVTQAFRTELFYFLQRRLEVIKPHAMALTLLSFFLSFFPLSDVCASATSEESNAVVLEDGPLLCAHRPVQHSKVGGAILTR